jgi:carbamoylphosphate synthase large subunit
MKERLHILVLDGGAERSPAIMRALKERNARLTLGVGRGSVSPAAASRYPDDVVRHPPLQPGHEFLAFLQDLVRNSAVDVVLPLQDEALIALQSYRAELERIVPLAAPPADCVASALDKAVTVARARRVTDGLATPATIMPDTAAEAVEAWTGRFPVVVKPRVGTGAEGIRLARDENELARVFELVSRQYPRPLVQEHIEYLPGEKFILLYLFDDRRELRSWYCQRIFLDKKSLRMGVDRERTRGGVALLWETHEDLNLMRRGRVLLEALGWSGLAVIDCARDRRDGRYYLFEINARLNGSSTQALRRGPNFAYDSCLVALHRPLACHLDFAQGCRARNGPLTMLDAREWRSILGLLDPRFSPPIPILLDPAPLVWETVRLVRKRLPRSKQLRREA